MTSGVDICGAILLTKAIVLSSGSISGSQDLTLQKTPLPIVHTADTVPPVCTRRKSESDDGSAKVVGGTISPSLAFRIMYAHSSSSQAATAPAYCIVLIRSHTIDPMDQRLGPISLTDWSIDKGMMPKRPDTGGD